MNNTIDLPIKVTKNALDSLKRTYSSNIDKKYIRIGVKGGGCAGLSYTLAEDDSTDDDQIFSIEGLNFVVNKAHLLYLSGVTLHMGDGLENRGFEFINPNATNTCGCGSSFNV